MSTIIDTFKMIQTPVNSMGEFRHKVKILKSSKDYRDEVMEEGINNLLEQEENKGWQLEEIKLHPEDLPLIALIIFKKPFEEVDEN